MTNSVIISAIRFVSLLFGGLFAGFLVTASVLEATLRSFDALVYVQVRQVELAHLDDLASATLIPTLIGAAFLVISVARARGRAFWLMLAALVLLVTVFVTSLLVNLPINHDQLTWNIQAPPADWAAVRDRWQIAHAVRTAAALLAFGCLIVAAIGPTTRTGNGHVPPLAQRQAAAGGGA
jgi:uncharacterized membrane protein